MINPSLSEFVIMWHVIIQRACLQQKLQVILHSCYIYDINMQQKCSHKVIYLLWSHPFLVIVDAFVGSTEQVLPRVSRRSHHLVWFQVYVKVEKDTKT